MPPFVEIAAIRKQRRNAIAAYLNRCKDRPVSAAELATLCRYSEQMGHETRRRRVRELIRTLREEEGARICAGYRKDAVQGSELGYWAARSEREWQAYLESRRSSARFEFALTRRMADAAADRNGGQMRLPLTHVLPGHAMMDG